MVTKTRYRLEVFKGKNRISMDIFGTKKQAQKNVKSWKRISKQVGKNMGKKVNFKYKLTPLKFFGR